MAKNSERERDDRRGSRGSTRAQGFRLSSTQGQNSENLETENALREKEHENVKVGLFTVYTCLHINCM
jgi:hypothetical protein